MDDFKQYLSGHSKSLTEGYVWRVRLFLEWLAEFNLQQEELQLGHFQGYISHLQEEDNKAYKIRLSISALRNYGYMLVLNNKANEKLAMELYIKGIYKTPFPSLFEWNELEQMYHDFNTPGIVGQRNKRVLNLVIYQGITPEEAINLFPEHLDLTKKTLTIPDTYKGRGRILPLKNHQIPLLEIYLNEVRPKILIIANKEDERLFITTSGNPKGKNITDNLLTSLKSKYPQIISYAQIRASVLHHWYTQYGLDKIIEMAGHGYINQLINK